MDDISSVNHQLLIGGESKRVGKHSLLHNEVGGVEKGEKESGEEDSENGMVHGAEYKGDNQGRKVIGGVNSLQKMGVWGKVHTHAKGREINNRGTRQGSIVTRSPNPKAIKKRIKQ